MKEAGAVKMVLKSRMMKEAVVVNAVDESRW